jgi:hypothetical protein
MMFGLAYPQERVISSSPVTDRGSHRSPWAIYHSDHIGNSCDTRRAEDVVVVPFDRGATKTRGEDDLCGRSGRSRHDGYSLVRRHLPDITSASGLASPVRARSSYVIREDFLQIDLSRVTPSETLKHLRAVVSKAPHRLTPIDDKKGVRG